MHTYSQIDLDQESIEVRDDAMVVRKSTVGGLRILTEKIPGQRSVALGLWIGAGSRDEAAGAYGSTHFLEHLLFKGTKTRSAAQIAEETDFLGGDVNAMTAKQFTCYHGRVFPSDLPQLADLLVDMVTSARLAESDMLLERDVILDELAMYATDPSEVAHEALPATLLGSHPLARPVGGTKESMAELDHRHLTDHYLTYYHRGELVVTAAGDIDHDEVVTLITSLVDRAGWVESEPVTARRTEPPINFHATQSRIVMPGEQTAVIAGIPGLPKLDERRYALQSAITILGGGTSSRLFQEIRDKRGLAYSAYSYATGYATGGLVGLAAPTSPAKAELVSELIGEVLDDLARGGVTEAEVDSAFRRVRAALVFDAESVHNRMIRLGVGQLTTGVLTSMTETLRRSGLVGVGEVVDLVRELAQRPRSLVIAGPEVD